MLLAAIRKECRIVWRDGRFRWTASILALTLAISAAVGLRTYQQRAHATAEAEREQRRQWLNKTAVNAHVAAHEGITLFRPLDVLASLDTGVDNLVGVSIYLEPHRRNLFANSALETSPRAGRFPELSAATTLQIVMPLVIILLTFGAFASEREQGIETELVARAGGHARVLECQAEPPRQRRSGGRNLLTMS